MNQASLEHNRYIMMFPKNSPIGLRILNYQTFYYVHPEYEPLYKIRAGVIGYNFIKDLVAVGNSIGSATGTASYDMLDMKVQKPDAFAKDVNENPGIEGAFGGTGTFFPFFGNITQDDCKYLECFEYLSEMPFCHLTDRNDGDYEQLYARPSHSGLAINSAQAEIWGIGARFSAFMPVMAPARLYHSTDSEILSQWMNTANLDITLKTEFEKSAMLRLIDYFKTVNNYAAVTYIGLLRRYSAESTGYGSENKMRSWWRYGPHTYMIYQTIPMLGVVVFPMTWYEYSWYFLNDKCITPTTTPVNSNSMMVFGGRMICLDTSTAQTISNNLYYITNSGSVYRITESAVPGTATATVVAF